MAAENEIKFPGWVKRIFCMGGKETAKSRKNKIDNTENFIKIFCSVGIVTGLLIIWAGIYCSNADVIQEYDALQESGNNRDAAIIDVEDFKKLSVIFIFVGFIVSFFSLFGLTCVLNHEYMFFRKSLLVFSFGYLLFFQILLVASILTFAVNAKDINAKIKQDSVRFWRMATHPASPFDKFLRRYEMDNNCCGWNNAIDYCDQTALYSLMETVIDQKATLKAINYNADAETDYSSSFYPEYSSNVYSVDFSSYSSSSNDALKSASDYGYCSEEEEYDGDEACICNTVESFGSAGNGFLDLKYLTCIHNSEVCHFSESITCASDNPEEEEYQPWRTTAFPQNISISEVCGAETCFINGCGDIFSDDFWKYGFTSMLLVAFGSSAFFTLGFFKTIQFTILVWNKTKVSLTESNRFLRPFSDLFSAKKTSTKAELEPLN